MVVPSSSRRLKTHREGVGVQLYAMQQQLARLQVALEQTHADFNGLGEGRARAELDTDSAKGRYTELKETGEALQKRLVKNESEFNALQETLRQVKHCSTVKVQKAAGAALLCRLANRVLVAGATKRTNRGNGASCKQASWRIFRCYG